MASLGPILFTLTKIDQSNSDSKFVVKSLAVYKEVLNFVFM